MGSAELTAHTRLPLRYDRKAEPCHKDAFVQQHVTHFYGGGRLAHDYWDDWGLSRERLEPGLGDRRPEITGVVAELLHQLRVVLQMVDRSEGTRRNSGRQRVRKELWPRPLGEHVAQGSGSRHEAARRSAQRLAERGCDDVDFAENPEMLRSSPSGRAKDSGPMRIVDGDYRVVIFRELE